MGGKPDNIYQSDHQAIRGPSRLYVFSDGVYDITKADGSIWGFNDFLEFKARAFKADETNLDRLITHAQELASVDEFDDDFTILEITFQ